MTTFKLYEHNSKNGNRLWFPWRGHLYDVTRIYDTLVDIEGLETLRLHVRPSRPSAMAKVMFYLEHLGFFPPPRKPHVRDVTNNNRKSQHVRLRRNNNLGHPEAMIAVVENLVDSLTVLTPNEKLQYFRSQLDNFIENLIYGTFTVQTETDELLLQIARRHLDTLEEKFGEAPTGDGNDHLYLLPPSVNPLELTEHRTSCLVTSFDDDIGPLSGCHGEPEWTWEKFDQSDVDEQYIAFLSITRDSVPFDTALPDSEVVWEEMPDKVVKYDELLPAQEVLLKSRAARTDLDSESARRRHDLILHSFQVKYGFSDEKIEPYKRWCLNMEESWTSFTELR